MSSNTIELLDRSCDDNDEKTEKEFFFNGFLKVGVLDWKTGGFGITIFAGFIE